MLIIFVTKQAEEGFVTNEVLYFVGFWGLSFGEPKRMSLFHYLAIAISSLMGVCVWRNVVFEDGR